MFRFINGSENKMKFNGIYLKNLETEEENEKEVVELNGSEER
jgi:hypothetical protein